MIYNEHSVSVKTARPQPGRDLTYSDVEKLSPSDIWLSFTFYSYHKHSLKAAIQGINTPAVVNTSKPHVCTVTLLSDHEPLILYLVSLC